MSEIIESQQYFLDNLEKNTGSRKFPPEIKHGNCLHCGEITSECRNVNGAFHLSCEMKQRSKLRG